VHKQLYNTVFADCVLVNSVATNPMSVTVVIKVRWSRQSWNIRSFVWQITECVLFQEAVRC